VCVRLTRKKRANAVTIVRRLTAYGSWASPSTLSSILMSFSSLDSKTSRHSRHSTNSASSSRATICTRGCLQGGFFVSFGWENGFEVIIRKRRPFGVAGGIDREFPGILALLGQLSSPCGLISFLDRAGHHSASPPVLEVRPSSPPRLKPFNRDCLLSDPRLSPMPARPCANLAFGRKMNYDRKGRN
jgi:hypothetical protein